MLSRILIQETILPNFYVFTIFAIKIGHIMVDSTVFIYNKHASFAAKIGNRVKSNQNSEMFIERNFSLLSYLSLAPLSVFLRQIEYYKVAPYCCLFLTLRK